MCWYLPEYLPVWSCVYIYVVNCIHNQIFSSVFQFLFVLACDATQASACSASAVTPQHQTMSAVHCICSGFHAFITTSPSDLQHYYCIQVATHVAPCKVIQESPGFQIPRCGFWIPDSGFHVCGFQIPHPWIPDSMDSISWIPDSTDQNYLDSGFRITLHAWGDTWILCDIYLQFCSFVARIFFQCTWLTCIYQ